MYKIEPMLPSDIFSLDSINLDEMSESFPVSYYLYYLVNHSEDCVVVCSTSTYESSFVSSKNVHGYMMGKLEEKDGGICAHVSAVTVAPGYRKSNFGRLCMDILEKNGNFFGAHFADLYVREANVPAIRFYERLGYIVYRKILGYYSEVLDNALDMRKSLDADPDCKYMARGADISASDMET